MSRRRPYDRDRDPDDWGERAEWRALVESDFDGIPREALIASIRSLAGRLLEDMRFGAPDPAAPKWPDAPMTAAEIQEHRKWEAQNALDAIRTHHGQTPILPATSD